MKPRNIIISAGAIIIALIGAFFLLLNQERKGFEEEKEELARLQREAMQEELATLSDEYQHQYNKLTINGQERQLTISQDSLIKQLSSERAKVDRLLEELSQVKTTSARRIAELTKEVGTLRRVLRTYVAQMDSLHTINEALKVENKQVKERFDKATNEVRQLASERNELSNQVKLAAKLDATAIAIQPLNRKGKATKNISKVESIQISFRIAKNITAQVGNKTFYTRIMNPDDEVMLKPGAGSFSFEGKELSYSTRREIEYNGEETPIVMYWAVEESLQSGTYRVLIFADGNLIGSSSFSL